MLGPKFNSLVKNLDTQLLSFWISGGICVLLTLSIYFYHAYKIKSSRPSTRRTLYSYIIPMPAIYGSAAFINLLFPRTTELVTAVQRLAEAVAIKSFFELQLYEMGGAKLAISRMQKRGPRPYLAVPPFCCCTTCCPNFLMKDSFLMKARIAIMQFVISVPVLAILQLWIELERASDQTTTKEQNDYDKIKLTFAWFEGISVGIAFCGMFVIFRALREEYPIYELNPGLKLIMIKLAVFLGMIQKFIIAFAMIGNLDINDDDDPVQEENGVYPTFYNVNKWKAFLLSVESFPLAILMMYAFPASEIGRPEATLTLFSLLSANPELSLREAHDTLLNFHASDESLSLIDYQHASEI